MYVNCIFLKGNKKYMYYRQYTVKKDKVYNAYNYTTITSGYSSLFTSIE